MPTDPRLRIAIEALERIRDFGHAEDCLHRGVPVHECGCYTMDESTIAGGALRRITSDILDEADDAD